MKQRKMSDLVADAGIASVDMWILDCVGCELGALRTFDFENVPVRILNIKRNANDLEIERLLRHYHFEYVREQQGNRVYENSRWPGE